MNVTYRLVEAAEGLIFVLNTPYTLLVQRSAIAKQRASEGKVTVEVLDAAIAQFEATARTIEAQVEALQPVTPGGESPRARIVTKTFSIRAYTWGERLQAIAEARNLGSTEVDVAELEARLIAVSTGRPISEIKDLPIHVATDLASRVQSVSEPSPDVLDFLLSAQLN